MGARLGVRSIDILIRELVDELARIIWDADIAKLLLLRAEFPRQHLPDFKTPLGFWTHVLHAAHDGTFRGGVQALVDEAVLQFPNNELLCHHQQLWRLKATREADDPPLDDDALRSSCAELLLHHPEGRASGIAQAIAPTTLLTCAHLVENAETVWLQPRGAASPRLEATVIRDAIDVGLDAALLDCPAWPSHGSVSPVCRELPTVGAPVKGLLPRLDDGTETTECAGVIEGVYFGLGNGRERVMVRGTPWEDRFSGALLYDSDTNLAWGLASTTTTRSKTLDGGVGLNVATTIHAILARFHSQLDAVVPEEPPGLERHRVLGERGWALLWRTGSLASKRAVHQHLPFFVKGDSPSPNDIARGEAYPRRAATEMATFFARAWEAPRWGIISGQRGDGKTTLALLVARRLHEQGTQILLHRGNGEPDLRSCAAELDAAPVLFLIERPRASVAWYQRLSDSLTDVHAVTRQAADVLLIDPPSDVLHPGTEYGQIVEDMEAARPTRLLKLGAEPTFAEIDPTSLYQHVRRVYTARAYACEQELASPFGILQQVSTSRALLRGLFGKLSEHAGIPAAPLRSRPPWLTPSLVGCITLVSSLGLTLPWSLARSLVSEIPEDLADGEWTSIGWHERGLRYGHSDQASRPAQDELVGLIERVLALALLVGDSEFTGALTLALLQDPECRERTQQLIIGQLTHAPRPAVAQMLWSTYLSCSNDTLRRAIVELGLASAPHAVEEARTIFARIVFADTWRMFREVTKREPGSRIGPEMREVLLCTREKLEELASGCSGNDVKALPIQVAAILHVVDVLSGNDTVDVGPERPGSRSARELDDYWGMVLQAFGFLIDERSAKPQLVHILEGASLPERGPGVHERLAHTLFKLYQRSRSEPERNDILDTTEHWAPSGARGSELRAVLARMFYMEHVAAVRTANGEAANRMFRRLDRLYVGEPEHMSIRFHFLGALVNAHYSAVQDGEREKAGYLVAHAQLLERPDDPSEVRSRLSVLAYNVHRSTVERERWSDANAWLMRLHRLKDREDADSRSQMLFRMALENLLISTNQPSPAAEPDPSRAAHHAALSTEERQHVERTVATTTEIHGWVALSGALRERRTDDERTKTELVTPADIQTTERITQLEKLPDFSLRKSDACLVVIYGAELGRKYDVQGRELTIGRSMTNDICVNHDSVSRMHASIVADDDGDVTIVDNESTNGTYVNGKRIGKVRLENHDHVKVGRSIFKVFIGYNVESSYQEEIYQLTTRDWLTQVFNKRYFTESLEVELAKARRYDRPLALMMLDIDGFKRCNEVFGYRAGDHVLRQLAELVRERVREDGVVARYGGEELAVILPKQDLHEATAKLGEPLREAIEQARFEFESQHLAITVSVGLAELAPDMAKADELTQKAWAHVRCAKHLGGNCVAITDQDAS